jgi:predicted dehydrogenase
MRALLQEIGDGVPAPTTAADALQTLRLVEAGYASIASGQVEPLAPRDDAPSPTPRAAVAAG